MTWVIVLKKELFDTLFKYTNLNVSQSYFEDIIFCNYAKFFDNLI